MTETEGPTVVADPGPRMITVERRFALAGAVATASVIAALAVALILDGGDSRGDHPQFGPGGPGYGSAMPGQAGGFPGSPHGGYGQGAPVMPTPEGVAPAVPASPAPNPGNSSRGGSSG